MIADYIQEVLDNPQHQRKVMEYIHEQVMRHTQGQANPHILQLEITQAFKTFWPNWK